MTSHSTGGRLSLRAKRLLFAAAVFGLWEVCGRFVFEPIVFPPVSAVVVAFVDILFGPLPGALAQSLQLLVIGYAFSLVLAAILGVALGRYRLADRTIGPYAYGLYATPPIALVPLVLVWFGFGLGGRVVVVFLAAFFPILINIYAGVRDAPQGLIEVARSFGVTSEPGLLRRVVIPAAMPFVMAGVRLGIGRAVVGMAVAEVFLRLGGIGALIVQYGAVFKTAYVMAAILPLPLLGIGLTKAFTLLERRYEGWRFA